MLSGVLRSPTAVAVNIEIMRKSRRMTVPVRLTETPTNRRGMRE